MNVESRTPSESKVEAAHILLPSNLNGSHRLFGGQLLQWIDLTGAACARRHSNRNVTTVLVDQIVFHAPAFDNEMVVLDAGIVFVGTTSMEVQIESFVEALDGTRRLINTAHVTYVALDVEGHPCKVPALIPQTSAERAAFEDAKKRYEQRKGAPHD